MNNNTPDPDDFMNRFNRIRDNLVEIACEYVEAIEKDPEFAGKLKTRGMNAELLRRLERLGRGQIHPSLTFDTSPGAVCLIAAPLSEQVVAVEQGVPVLELDEVTVRNIPLHEVTPKQAKQALSGGHVKTIAEQRTYIRDQKAKQMPVNLPKNWKVTKDGVLITQPGLISWAVIAQWLAERG